MNPSKQHSNWVTVGEVIRLVKKPVAAYADHIVKTFHAKLLGVCQSLGQCSNPGNCLKKNNCPPCNGWYQELASSHRNAKKSQIKGSQNCDSSKWPVDAWEVAKFFMSDLGDNKSNVQDAESTDLSSLLNVLEWMKDVAFGGDRRVDLKLVKDLRSDVRNAWAHAPKQEMTEDELNKVFEIANKFLEDLDKVFAHVEIKKCMTEIQSLQANGLTDVIETDLKNLVLLRRELSRDVSQMKEDIKGLKQDQNSDSLVIHENEKKLKNLEDFTEECSSRMEDFQKWKENLDKLFNDIKVELDSFREETRRDIGGMRADIKELQDAKNVRDAAERFEPKSCLPEKLSTFVGREKEISAINSSLVNGRGIVSLIGGPGFGKSSIAVEVSHRLREEHGIPVIFSYLSTTSTVAEVVRRLCLDVGVQPGEDPNSSLMVWLRNIKRRVILVLDNVEQLLEGETSPEEFRSLLRSLRKDSSQFLQIITTSRKFFEVAEVDSECCSVETMDAESSMELLMKLCPDFDLQNDDSIKLMIELCGHVPLALRLLAFRLKNTEDRAQLVPEWLQDQPMEVLQTPDEKVRKTIEKSFEILQSEEKRHFVRLSVLEGNFNREAAQHVTELVEIKAENVLAELVDRSLLQRSGGNYIIHPLIRSYLTEIQEFAEERKRAQELMVEHFLRKCHQLTLLYWSKDGSNAARKALKEILHHVEKVLKICKEASSETNPNSVIVDTLIESEIYKSSSRFFYNFILHILSLVLVRNFLECCAMLAKNLQDVVAELNFTILSANEIGRSIGWKSKEYQKSMELVKQSFNKIEENQLEISPELKSHFSFSYGWYQFDQQLEKKDKCEYLQEYLKIESEKQIGLGKDEEQSNQKNVDQVLSLTQCGRVLQLFKEMEKAEDYYGRALIKSKECLGNHELTLNCHKRLGDIKLEKRNYEEALKYYEMAKETHEVLEIIDYSVSSVYVLENRGVCLSFLERHQEAVEVLKKACSVIEKQLGDNSKCKFNVYSRLAEALERQTPGCPEAAEYAEKAVVVSENVQDKKIWHTNEDMKKIVSQFKKNKQ